jgi:hypothetical protein
MRLHPIVHESIEGAFDGLAPGRDPGARVSAVRLVEQVGAALFACQLVALVVLSVVRYRHFDLAEDFGIYAQAMHQIAHGHLDPWSTVYGYPFWQNNFEWFVWPLGLLSRVVPAPVLLLGLQDACLAATGWLALRWWRRAAEAGAGRRGGGAGSIGILAAGVAVLAVPLASPLVYATAGFDFHSEAVAAPLLVAVGYDLWAGRRRRCWIWAVLLLSTSGIAATYLIAVALAGLVLRWQRPTALALLVVAIVYFSLVGLVGGVRPGVVDGYAYLAGGGHPTTMVGVVGAVVAHPAIALRTIAARWHDLARIAVASGGIGLLWPAALFVDVAVMVPPALNNSPVFVSPPAAFQVVPLLGPMAAGAGMAIMALTRDLRRGGASAAAGCMAGAVIACLAAATVTDTAVWTEWSAVPPAPARVLNEVAARITPGTEVIAVSGISGRFSARSFFFVLGQSSVVFPVCSSEIVVVLTNAGVEGGFTPPAMVAAALRVVEHAQDAATLVSAHGVWAYRLRPPRGTSEINLDPAIATGALGCRSPPHIQ